MDAPPPRYRVVEKGRRLVVVDQRAERSPAGAAPAARAALFERRRFDGSGVLTTERWFDDKGPRRLAIDGGSATWVRLALAAAGPIRRLMPIVGGSGQDALRRATTDMLDRFLPAEDR